MYFILSRVLFDASKLDIHQQNQCYFNIISKILAFINILNWHLNIFFVICITLLYLFSFKLVFKKKFYLALMYFYFSFINSSTSN